MMTPSSIFDVLPNVFVRLHGWSRFLFDEAVPSQDCVIRVSSQCFAGHVNGLDHSVKVECIGSSSRRTSVEIVKVDDRSVKRVSRPQLHCSSTIASVCLQSIPGPMLVICNRSISPARVVAREIHWSAKDEHVNIRS